MRLYHQPPGNQEREQTSGSAMKDEARQDRQENSLPTKVKVETGVKKRQGTENIRHAALKTPD